MFNMLVVQWNLTK